jgi:hypothetical protein
MAGDAIFSKVCKASDTIAELCDVFREEYPKSEPPTFLHESDKVPVDSNIAKYTSLTATRPLVDGGLPDLIQFPHAHVQFAIGDFHGLATGLGLQQFKFDEARASKWSEAEADISFFADIGSLSSEFDKAIATLREAHPANVLTLVVVAKDFDSFKCSNIAHRLNSAVENVDLCVCVCVCVCVCRGRRD